jgi:hypothetical protein
LQKNLVADLEFINKNNNNNSTFELRSKANQRTTMTNCECGTQFLQIALELDSRARNKKGEGKIGRRKKENLDFLTVSSCRRPTPSVFSGQLLLFPAS